MLINMLIDAFTYLYKTYSVDTFAGFSARPVNGRKTKVTTTISIDLAIIPMDKRTIEVNDGLDLTLQDIKIYREGVASQLPDNSIITYKTDKYKVRTSSDRTDEGGFSFWIAKKITK